MYFLRNFRVSSWFVFRRSLLCFLVFRCSIFKVRFASALRDSLFSISHPVLFVKAFFKVFLTFFSTFFRLLCLLAPRPVNASAWVNSKSSRIVCLMPRPPLGLSRLCAPSCGALLYYHISSLLSTPFFTFSPLFSHFFHFSFVVSSFRDFLVISIAILLTISTTF